MISAMPAVAVRRERKKSKSHRGAGGGGGGGRVSKQASLSTISSTVGQRNSYASRLRDFYRRDKQRLRVLVYGGTVLMGSGLILVFIGVGTSASAFQTVGLLFIGLGSLLCLVKIFCGHGSFNDRDITKRLQNAAIETHSTQMALTIDGSEYPVMMVQTIPLSALEETDVASRETGNISPTVKTTVPEMQIVITEKPKERY